MKRGYEATNHIEVVSFPCRIAHSVLEHEIHGEGASWNCLQLQMMIKYHYSKDATAIFPIRLFIDDACSTIVHLLCELARFSRGEPTVLEPWVLFMLVASDICVDGFHHQNHREFWCRKLLNPAQRSLPDNWNTQAGEQNFQEIVKKVGGLREMKAGRNRFFLMSMYMISNLQLSQTPMAQRDTQTHMMQRGYSGKDKHKEREASRKRQLNLGLKTRSGKPMVRGRFPVPKDFIKKYPRGFPEGLAKKSICGALHHTHVAIALFKKHENHLGELVKSLLPARNQSSERRFTAAGALKDFLATHLEIANPHVDFTKPGAFAVEHSCRRCDK